jgi:hypothetical protein
MSYPNFVHVIRCVSILQIDECPDLTGVTGMRVEPRAASDVIERTQKNALLERSRHERQRRVF